MLYKIAEWIAKIFFGGLFVLGLFLINSNSVKAYVIANQNIASTSTVISFTNFDSDFPFATTTSTKIGSITVNASKNPAYGALNNVKLIINCGGTEYTSDNSFTVDQTIAESLTYVWNTGNQCDTTSGVNYFKFDSNVLTWTTLSDVLAKTRSCSSGIGGSCTDLGFDTYFIIYDGDGTSLAGNKISWQNPPFSNGLVTPDFSNWGACLNWTPGQTNITSFNWKIYYGTTTNYTLNDNYASNLGLSTIPLDPNLTSTCLQTTKTSTTSPGTIFAELRLYDQNGGIVSISPVYHFTIIAGDINSLPSFNNSPFNPSSTPATIPVECKDYSFNVLGADFGMMGCRMIKFLFVPNFSMTLLDNTTQQLHNTAPFSYWFQAQNDIIVNSASTSSTTLAFIYSATSTPIKNVNVNLKTAVTNLTTSNGFNEIYNAIGYAIWFAVGIYFIFRIKNLL